LSSHFVCKHGKWLPVANEVNYVQVLKVKPIALIETTTMTVEIKLFQREKMKSQLITIVMAVFKQISVARNCF